MYYQAFPQKLHFWKKNIRQRLGIDAEELIVVFFTDLSMRALSRCRCRLFAGPRRHRGKPSIAQTTKLLKRHQLSTVKHLTILCLTSPLPRVIRSPSNRKAKVQMLSVGGFASVLGFNDNRFKVLHYWLICVSTSQYGPQPPSLSASLWKDLSCRCGLPRLWRFLKLSNILFSAFWHIGRDCNPHLHLTFKNMPFGNAEV